MSNSAVVQQYLDLGLPIIPLCPHDAINDSRGKPYGDRAGKVPLIKWQQWKETTQEHVNSWIRQFKKFNLGLPLGSVSGFVGIDIDGEAGETMLQEMSGGDLPDTWEFATSAGRRLLYQIPVGLQTKKFKQTGEGEHEECAILCDGQQTVLPPSIHLSGKVYTWTEDHTPEDLDCAMAPKWLIDLIRLDVPRFNGTTIDFTGGTASVNVAEMPDDLDDELDLMGTGGMDTFKLSIPEGAEGGKTAKGQKHEIKVTEDMLTQPIPAGNRDNTMTAIIGHFCAKYRALGKDKVLLIALQHNQQYCDPPLEPETIKAKVNHFWEMEKVKSAQFKEAAGVHKAPTDDVIAQEALNYIEDAGWMLKIQKRGDVFWMCRRTEGPWKPEDPNDTEFQKLFMTVMNKYGTTSKSKYANVVHNLVMLIRSQGRYWDTDNKNIDTQTWKDSRFIPLKGGKLLEWETGELHPWDPETHLTYVLPIDYDPEATCPYWLAKLEEWLPGDIESQMVLQEYIGYAMVPYMKDSVAMMLVGGGANGKSIFTSAIDEMFGKDVVSNKSIKDLMGQYEPQYLAGKMLNISNEAGAGYISREQADVLKKMISGEAISAQVKNKDSFVFNNTASFIFNTNHPLRAQDKSDGWIRRWLLVPFTQSFANSGISGAEIMTEIRKEFPGIFNWAIQGLLRFKQQGHFTQSKAIKQQQQNAVEDNDIAADFFNNCLEVVNLTVHTSSGREVMKGTSKSKLVELFKAWCKFRDNATKKHRDTLDEYLGERKKIPVGKPTVEYMFEPKAGIKKQAPCWMGIRINVKNDDFLDVLENDIEFGEYTGLLPKDMGA